MSNPAPSVPRFGKRLREARVARGLTMGQVVARVHQTGPMFEGFTQAQLSRYEAGRTLSPDPAVLWRLANLYANVTVKELIDLLVEERDARAVTMTNAESPPAERRPARGRRTGSR